MVFSSGRLSLIVAFAMLQEVFPTPTIFVKEGIVAEHKEVHFEIDLFNPLTSLNRVNFGQSVLEESRNGVQRWVVLFCLDWFDQCQALERPFAAMGTQWEGALNEGLFSTEVRFATVNCAADKVLCNDQNITRFPMVKLYHDHAAVASWAGQRDYKKNMVGLTQWMQKHLGSIAAGEPKDVPEDLNLLEWALSMVAGRSGGFLDILVMVFTVLGNAWVVSRNPEFRAEPAWSGKQQPEPEFEGSIGRFLPTDWAIERASVEL